MQSPCCAMVYPGASFQTKLESFAGFAQIVKQAEKSASQRSSEDRSKVTSKLADIVQVGR